MGVRNKPATLLSLACCFFLLTSASAQERPRIGQRERAELDGKRLSPPTALGQFPKLWPTGLATSPSDRTALEGMEPGNVAVIDEMPNGDVHMRIYIPAEVTPQELAAKLRAEGHPNVQVLTATNPSIRMPQADSSKGDVSAEWADQCSWGISRSLLCPPVYWTNDGYSDPQVAFSDYSGAAWLTDKAVYSWNQAPGIDSYYYWKWCAYKHCVEVFSGNYGSGAYGWIDHWWNNRRFYDYKSIYLNDYYNPWTSYYQRRSFICALMGYGLGLSFATSTASCTYYSVYASAYPHSDDLNMLGSIYSIYR